MSARIAISVLLLARFATDVAAAEPERTEGEPLGAGSFMLGAAGALPLLAAPSTGAGNIDFCSPASLAAILWVSRQSGAR